MELKSYLVEIGQAMGGRDERGVLTMAIVEDRTQSFWSKFEIGDCDGAMSDIIVTADAELLEELREAGWTVVLAPAGVYSGAESNIDDCIVTSDGAIPFRTRRG